jgi:hypothetical protein
MATPPTFSPRKLTELYVQRAFHELCTQFLDVLRYFEETSYTSVDFPTQRAIDAFAVHFVHLFSQSDFVVPAQFIVQFIRYNQTISNLVYLSPLETTDAYLELVRYQKDNLVKVLTLYSARNRCRFNLNDLFAVNPELVSIWYTCFGGSFHGALVEKATCDHLAEHYAYDSEVFHASDNIADVYYGSSYVDGHCDRHVKESINRFFFKAQQSCRIINRPNPKKIAVMSCLWWQGHSSYRIHAAQLESLKDDFELTLFHMPLTGRPPDTRWFKEVHELQVKNGALDVEPLANNEFGLVYFPDIGMTKFSICLANLRIAPIQVCALGHSVSTFGAEIDYFISGAECEVPVNPDRFYSERLVLLPGCGSVNEPPMYQPTGRKKNVSEFVLNCPWSAQKINYRLLEMMQEIVKRSKKPLCFRIYVGTSLTRHASFLPCEQDLKRLLAPARVELMPKLHYQAYMASMEEGDLTIDAFHYGGCNTMADSLLLRIPMPSLEGERWYNRIGPFMLRQAGVPELVATSANEYIDLVTRLIEDDHLRERCAEKLRRADLNATVFDRGDARYFRKAIDYLLANHERLKQSNDRSPIRIERDS